MGLAGVAGCEWRAIMFGGRRPTMFGGRRLVGGWFGGRLAVGSAVGRGSVGGRAGSAGGQPAVGWLSAVRRRSAGGRPAVGRRPIMFGDWVDHPVDLRTSHISRRPVGLLG